MLSCIIYDIILLNVLLFVVFCRGTRKKASLSKKRRLPRLAFEVIMDIVVTMPISLRFMIAFSPIQIGLLCLHEQEGCFWT